MGEMADWVNDSWDYWGPPDYEEEPPYPTYKTCRNCGEEGLVWQTHNGKWRLFTAHTGLLHNCSVKPLKES